MSAPKTASAPWLPLLLAGCAAMTGGAPAGASFRDAFERAPGPPGPEWLVTSGDMRVQDGTARTASPVFRAVTRRGDFRNVEVRLRLLNHGLTEGPLTPRVDWDGVHVFLRYQSQFHLYYASVNRRDGTAVIKKKTPGGPSNGGTYHDLCRYEKHSVPYGAWQDIRVSVRDEGRGVRIEAWADGARIASAFDDGVGGPPIRSPGRVGLRADNADIEFDDFGAVETRTPLPDAAPAPVPPRTTGNAPLRPKI